MRALIIEHTFTVTGYHTTRIQGYKDMYSPMTFKCTQELVVVTLHAYSALTNRQNSTVSHVYKL